MDAAAARAGREAVQRWLRVRPHIADRAAAAFERQLDPTVRWLAVHLRRTDKLLCVSATASNRVGRAAIGAECRRFCAALGCGGVFLCTDDAQLKREVASDLANGPRTRVGGVGGAAGRPLRVATLPAVLSTRRHQASHKDHRLDRRQNAEDCLVEVLLMARCAALLSTWSNVSVAAVYFAPADAPYPHYMFGDLPPPTPALPAVLLESPPRLPPSPTPPAAVEGAEAEALIVASRCLPRSAAPPAARARIVRPAGACSDQRSPSRGAATQGPTQRVTWCRGEWREARRGVLC